MGLFFRKRGEKYGISKNIIREYVEAFGIAIILALVLRALVIQAFRIPTGSMENTLLVGDFLRRFDPSGKTTLSAEAIAFLTSLDYPGNVRQLKNIIERICIFYHATTVGLNELKSHLVPGQLPVSFQKNSTIPLSERVKNFERHLIQTVLKECDENISRAAKILQVDRANLSKKLKEMKIEKE